MEKKSSVWTDLYREQTPRAVKKQRHLIRFIKPHHNIFLELFTATGQNLEALRSKNSNAVCIGIDYDFALCNKAEKTGFLAVVGDCRQLPFKDGTFDLIYSNSFHHVADSMSEIITRSLDLLKPDGLLVGVEPYGLVAGLLAGIIFFLPDFLISLLPRNLKSYIRAIKYECRHEGVMDWYYKDFKKYITKYNVISINRDLLRVYYCIKNETHLL